MDKNVKMADMTRDREQLDVMVGNYNPKYPIGFFLDPKMVEELGIKDGVKSGNVYEVVGKIMVSSTTEQQDEDGDGGHKVEAYVHVTELGVVQKATESPQQKMAKAYNGDDDGIKQD